MIAGNIYVLAGECVVRSKDLDSTRVCAREFCEMPAGSYEITVTGTTGVQVVNVWRLPKEFWRKQT